MSLHTGQAQQAPEAGEAEGLASENLGQDNGRAAAVAGLRKVVAAMLVRRDPRIAVRAVTLERLADEAAGLAEGMALGALTGWLTGSGEAGLSPAQAKATTVWGDEHLPGRCEAICFAAGSGRYVCVRR